MLTKNRGKDRTNYTQGIDYTTRQLRQKGQTQRRTRRQQKTSWRRKMMSSGTDGTQGEETTAVRLGRGRKR